MCFLYVSMYGLYCFFSSRVCFEVLFGGCFLKFICFVVWEGFFVEVDHLITLLQILLHLQPLLLENLHRELVK